MRLLPLLLLLLLVACNSVSPEEKAEIVLQRARTHLAQMQYNEARDSIYSLRRQYPGAIEARAKALLLLDSIEIAAAKDSLRSATGNEWKRLSIKVQFFERKLQEDKKKLNL